MLNLFKLTDFSYSEYYNTSLWRQSSFVQEVGLLHRKRLWSKPEPSSFLGRVSKNSDVSLRTTR